MRRKNEDPFDGLATRIREMARDQAEMATGRPRSFKVLKVSPLTARDDEGLVITEGDDDVDVARAVLIGEVRVGDWLRVRESEDGYFVTNVIAAPGDVDPNVGSIGALSTRIGTLEGQTLDARLDVLEGQGLDGRLDVLEGQSLDGRLDVLEGQTLDARLDLMEARLTTADAGLQLVRGQLVGEAEFAVAAGSSWTMRGDTGGALQFLQLDFTPTVRCWWDVRMKTIVRNNNAAWDRVDAHTKLVAPGAAADVLGFTNGPRHTILAHSGQTPGMWVNVLANGLYKLEAGTRYVVQGGFVGLGSGSFYQWWGGTVTQLEAKVVGFW